MSLATSIANHNRTPCARVYLDGKRCTLRNVKGAITVSQAYMQSVATGVVQLINPPVRPVGGMSIRWEWGYDNQYVPGFTGIVTKVLKQSYPDTWKLEVKDELWRAEMVKQDVNLLNNKTAKVVIETLLGMAGLTKRNIPALKASGSAWSGDEWMLGTLTPIAFSGQSLLAAAQSVAAVLGYWLYCDASGVVQCIYVEGKPSSSPFRTLKQGTDFLVEGPPERETDDLEAIYNAIVVTGAATGIEGAQITDKWRTNTSLLPDTVDRELTFNSDLIEYVNESEAGAASATGIAKRLLKVHDRQPDVVRFRLKSDPRIKVGMTLAAQANRLGLGAARPYFVYSIQRSFGGADFSDQYVLDGGVGDAGYSLIPPPVASFTWTLVQETLDGVDTIEVFLDGSSSTSMTEGEIVAYSWSDGTQTATGPKAVFFYPATQTSADITLTVTDTSSKTGSLTQTVPLTPDAATPLPLRTISVAAGTWYVTPNSGKTWGSDSAVTAVAVPPIGGANSALLSTGAASVKQTQDALATAATTRATLAGAGAFLWQNESDPQRITAAIGDALYQSSDGGVTFTSVGVVSAGQAIHWVIERADQPGVYEVLAGSGVFWGGAGSFTQVV